jgi:acyl carrier protein
MEMTEHEVLAGFAAIVEEFTGVSASNVTPEANLVDELEIDSLSMVEIIAAVQDEFGVEIPDEHLRDLKSARDVVDYVRQRRRSDVPG